MTKEERSILEMLDKIVHSEPVRPRIEPIIERVRTDLAGKPDALMSWEPVELETFGEQLPAAIHSGWVFILRAGVDTGADDELVGRIVAAAGEDRALHGGQDQGFVAARAEKQSA